MSSYVSQGDLRRQQTDKSHDRHPAGLYAGIKQESSNGVHAAHACCMRAASICVARRMRSTAAERETQEDRESCPGSHIGSPWGMLIDMVELMGPLFY